MQGRIEFLEETIQSTEDLAISIADRVNIDPDLNLVLEAVEVLQEELRALQ